MIKIGLDEQTFDGTAPQLALELCATIAGLKDMDKLYFCGLLGETDFLDLIQQPHIDVEKSIEVIFNYSVAFCIAKKGYTSAKQVSKKEIKEIMKATKKAMKGEK